jgi:hypothetical protein
MELKGKTREGELVTLLSGKDSYTIEVVASEDDKSKKKSDKAKEPVRIGNYKNEFPKKSLEMYEIKKHDGETGVKIKFAGERFTFSFVTETPYEKVVEMLEVGNN